MLKDQIAKAICQSGKFENGQGCCAAICMENLGSARTKCCRHSEVHGKLAAQIAAAVQSAIEPIPMRLPCESCGVLHIDEGEFATKPHHTHACQHCGAVWRPALAATVGVRFLPGFKNEGEPSTDALVVEGAGLLEKVKQACLFGDDDGGIGVSDEAYISSDLFASICDYIKRAR